MYNSGNFQEAAQALQTRTTLEELNFRDNHGTSPTKSAVTGTKFLGVTKNTKTSPVFDEHGRLFAGSIIGRADTGVVIPDTTGPGTIIAYQNENKQLRYGVVSKTEGKRPKGIHVKTLSKSEVDDLVAKRLGSDILTVDNSNLRPIRSRTNFLLDLFDTLDPTETIFFKILTKVLMGNILEIESVWELFIILYFRLMFLAIMVITVAYLVARLF